MALCIRKKNGDKEVTFFLRKLLPQFHSNFERRLLDFELHFNLILIFSYFLEQINIAISTLHLCLAKKELPRAMLLQRDGVFPWYSNWQLVELYYETGTPIWRDTGDVTKSHMQNYFFSPQLLAALSSPPSRRPL